MVKSILALTVIPLIGYLIYFGLFYNSSTPELSVAELTLAMQIYCSSDASGACERFNNLLLLKDSSIYSGLASILVVLSYFTLAKIAGTNRDILAKVFPSLIPLMLLLISAQTIVQGAILTYGIYVLQVELMGSWYPIMTGLIGLAVAGGAFIILGAVSSVKTKLIHHQMGAQLSPSDQPEIWGLVNGIAKEIESDPPDNIIVGLEPTFYATAADVTGCSDEALTGETLYLSLPLMRLFSKSELKAVIGHELGHFSAKDTEYSTKFAPVYKGLGNTVHALESNEGEGGALPALFLLSSMYKTFSENVASINRTREFEADKIGVSVSSARDLAYSLTKVILFSSMWNEVQQDNIKRLNKGKVSPNLSLIFKDSASYNLSKDILETEKQNVLNSTNSHPTDSHPLLSDRLMNIGFDDKEIVTDEVIIKGDSCSDLILNVEQIEAELTQLEHKVMLVLRYAKLPEEESQENTLETILYSMAAAMVGADGKIEQEEIAAAEQIGSQLIATFDKTDFRAYINNLESVPNIIDLASDLKSLDKENKEIILSYLQAIADADNELAQEEVEILTEIKAIWEIEDPPV